MRQEFAKYVFLGVVIFWLLVAAIVLAISYRHVDAGAQIAFGRSLAHLQRECQDPRVIDALLHPVPTDKFGLPRSWIADRIYFEFQTARNPNYVFSYREQLFRFQLNLWLKFMLSDEDLASVFCVFGGSGLRGYGMVKVGTVVGIADIPHVPDRSLRALAKVFVSDMRGNMSDDRIRELYATRLSGRTPTR
jgi:hypothetical protein